MVNAISFAAAVAVLACALMGGVFFAFSTFVMGALARLPAPQGIAAMQAINIVAITPMFMTALFGTAALCLVLIVAALVSAHAQTLVIVAGGALYLGGVILVTMLCNVPRNNALAKLDPAAPQAASTWARYLREWTAWNHVRAITGLMAAAAFLSAY